MQMEFIIDDLFAEAEEQSLYRADALIKESGDTMTERMAITENDHTLMATFLKYAADEVYLQLQTITFSTYPYVYAQKDKIIYNIINEYPAGQKTVLYSTIKEYLVEKMLEGWYRAKHVKDMAELSQMAVSQAKEKLNSLRFVKKGKLIYRGI